MEPKRPSVTQFLKRRDSTTEPSYFSHQGVTLSQLQSILSLSPSQRTDSHLKCLLAFTRHLKVFADWEGKKDRQVVFNLGDEGTKFYIILSGSCSVLIPTKRDPSEMQQVALLRQGQCFGELALISNKPRAATVASREETHFAVLERDAYNEILGKSQNEALAEKVSLLHKHPVFSSWTKSAIQRLSYFFKERTYTRKQLLFQAGEPSSEVFIIKRGELQLSQDVAFPRKKGSIPGLHSETSHCQIHVTIISDGEMIGAEEAIRLSKHRYTCRCHSTQGEVLVISQEDFRGQMSNEQAINYLQTMTKLKESYRLGRVTQAAELVKKEKWNAEVAAVTAYHTKNTPSEQLSSLKAALLQNTINGVKRGLTIAIRTERSNRQYSSVDLPSTSRLPTMQESLSRNDSCKGSPVKPYTRTWSEICASKFPVERLDKTPHRRQQSVVNFHTQLLRRMLEREDLRLQVTPIRQRDLQSLALIRLNLVVEPC